MTGEDRNDTEELQKIFHKRCAATVSRIVILTGRTSSEIYVEALRKVSSVKPDTNGVRLMAARQLVLDDIFTAAVDSVRWNDPIVQIGILERHAASPLTRGLPSNSGGSS